MTTQAAIDGATLCRISTYLEVRDAYAAACVCALWRDTLSHTNQNVWQDICTHNHPCTTQSFLRVQPDCNFKHLAKALCRDGESRVPNCSSSVELDNYFAVVEFYRLDQSQNKRRKVVVGSFSSDVVPPTDSRLLVHSETGIVIKAVNPIAASPEFAALDTLELERYQNHVLQRATIFPIEFTLNDAVGYPIYMVPNHRVDSSAYPNTLCTIVRLFRRDNLKSVVVFDTDKNCPFDVEYVEYFDDRSGVTLDGETSLKLPPSQDTSEGFPYLAKMREKAIPVIEPCISYDLNIQPPDGEAAWFASFKSGAEVDPLRGREISSFELKIQNFFMSFFPQDADGGYYRYLLDEESLKVVLDGLDWQ